jgi:hypothetical protein
LGKGIDNWASVDTFATMVAGPAWREGRVTDAAVLRWAGSEDRWWRRTAIVVTVALNQKARGGRGDTPRTLMMCERLVADRDDMVVKGLSWALRALLERDRAAVEGFLDRHGDGVAPRVRREVGNKLRSGLKNPRTGFAPKVAVRDRGSTGSPRTELQFNVRPELVEGQIAQCDDSCAKPRERSGYSLRDVHPAQPADGEP